MDLHEINNNALNYYKKNKGRVRQFIVMFVALQIITYIALNILSPFIKIPLIIALLSTVISYMLITLGLSGARLNALRKKDKNNPRLLQYFKVFSNKNAIILGLLIGPLNTMFLYVLFLSIIKFVKFINIEPEYTILLFAPVGLTSIWISIRLFLAPYLFHIGYPGSPIDIIKESFNLMRGNVVNYLKYIYIITKWRLLTVFALVIALFTAFLFSMGLIAAVNTTSTGGIFLGLMGIGAFFDVFMQTIIESLYRPNGSALLILSFLVIIVPVIICIISIYPYFALVGFADSLLPNTELKNK